MSDTPPTEPTLETPGVPLRPLPRKERVTVHVRVGEVLQLLLQGAGNRDIREHARENDWGVGPRQLLKYKSVALKELKKRLDKDNDRVLTMHLNRLEYLYARSVNVGDMRTAHGVLRDLAELRSFYPAKPGTFAAEQVLATLNAVDKLVGDLLTDDAAFTQYRDAMRGIVQALQATMGKG